MCILIASISTLWNKLVELKLGPMPSFSGEPSFSGALVFDVAIVGGGPAGLAAAMYLARFLRSVISLDAGHARAKLIPKSRNCPGFPDGISGEELLGRLRAQAQLYGASLVHGCVGHAEKREGFFVLTTTCGIVQARRVILATGIVDKAPPIERLEEAIATGIVRLCPVCDAYEARGSRIGVVGPEHLAVREALFLKGYGSQVALLANNQDDVSEAARGAALAGGVEIWDAVDDLIPRRTGFDVVMAEGAPMRNIDVVYPSMGSDVRSELAVALGANCDAEGYVLVNRHLETSTPGLYAIGDVAEGLNQIAVAFGDAAKAATHIHNDLRDCAEPATNFRRS
ncbi:MULTISPECIES: NAD(P)/FAD-dependent oxidoreductase [unclassified Mesorhizobium]|uniref:NAD(P)/FAD-dependent oxidoreductase n=2 Tax=unclassified Mesorhizobium TaxID=325217 RepID=UPI0003CEED51|nr:MULTISPECIES: NAD(P)/FAD-dependent oxidoreductase [unclassified Mesorhizobium]ESX26657.1 FAD-dependent pyridine nucleotide-disulfide oxidoreductase [Mesorhizobium sp. LSJC264A00]ESX90103.1 pyridine nucleotide-disulfide oxidoreductase [Mesorhizobium sp. LSHC412B00]ESY20110.1 pyridine nucleotide-disulfide oxidoreductase [Mesorhizobium sp. LNJC395A00]ESZ60811.1 FAD-dependent pyridine nucleotide-disulfide oxidoreductase [Mesorhizobium sp. L103C131B0]ESZ72175.1 pyridine nucleotide-disulfide oxid